MPNKIAHNKGLTIFEILTVTLIITLLVLIAVPNFVGSKDRSVNSNIKTNARVLRIMLENYKVDEGIYPENLRTLGRVATTKNYNKQAGNPVTGGEADVVESGKWAIMYTGTSGPPGMVVYQPIDSNNKYYILGYNSKGVLMQDKGQTFVMSNG